MFLLFLAPFSWGTQKREAAAPKVSGCFMGGTRVVWEEPGKQKPQNCRAQELARSSAQENEWQKMDTYRTGLSKRERKLGQRWRWQQVEYPLRSATLRASVGAR
jgi:hypothetical protein